MKINRKNFYKEIDTFICLPGEITTSSSSEFSKVFGSEEAGKHKEIVYIWLTEKPIPRVIGESNVLYIGQTKTSFKKRYLSYADTFEKGPANEIKYPKIIKRYGPIRICVAPYKRYGDTLKEAEGQLLWWYFQNHCEYPPINYTKTTYFKDVRNVE